MLCKACATKLPKAQARCYKCLQLSLEGRTCPACATASPLQSVRAATAYVGGAKQLVGQLKFNRAVDAARTIAIMCDARIPLPGDAIVTYVPTANSRVRLRGYDQAQRIARHLAHQNSLPLLTTLARTSEARQVGASGAQRRSQLASAFRPVRPYAIKDRHVILVDDVITTGSSLEACAQVLIAAGALDVRAVVFAQA
ncbi:MAG: ComF family protein [Candidatus Saccharibacteria bacterium]